MSKEKMSTELTVPGFENLATVDENLEKAFEETVSSSDFRRVQLFGASNDAVKKKQIPMGHFGIVDGQDIHDLGETFDCFIIDYRLKAMRIDDEVTVVFDFESDEFKAIVEESEIKDSGCLYGPEFLLWIPKHGFIPYHLNNKSARFEAKPMRTLLKKAATLKVVFIEGKEFSWYAPKVNPCTVPFDEMPSAEDVMSAIKSFRETEDVVVHTEKVDESTKTDR